MIDIAIGFFGFALLTTAVAFAGLLRLQDARLAHDRAAKQDERDHALKLLGDTSLVDKLTKRVEALERGRAFAAKD